MVSELISCRSGKLIVMVGSVEEKLRCVPSASLSDRGSGVLQRHTSVPIWHSHAFGVGLYGIYECCLKQCLLVLVAWTFCHHSPLFTVLLRIRKTWLPCCWGKLHHCRCRQQSANGENYCVVLSMCLNHVEEARRLAFLMGACSAPCENVFSSFCTSLRRVGLVCLRHLWKLFLAVVSVTFF